MTPRLLLIVLAASLLAACSTTSAYAPAAKPGGRGHEEMRIETDRFRVSFRGAADAEAAYQFALRRAAEVTIANGFDWFQVTRRTAEAGDDNRPRVNVGIGSGSYGRRSSVGVGVGVGLPVGERNDGAATLEIRLGRGARPAAADAYDARQVLGALERQP